MKIKRINIKNEFIRKEYSKKLQIFEEQFSYPLGDKRFYIKHGYENIYDYFSFFEQLGEVSYIVVEDKSTIVGVGCVILRNISNYKVWYLCDFKVHKNYRNKRILENIFRKYFLFFYFKAQKLIVINMNSPNKNGLVKKLERIFKCFFLDIQKLYFYEWNAKDFEQVLFLLDDYVIVHNKNKKDILIDEKPYNIYHLKRKDEMYQIENFQKVEYQEIKDDDTIMLTLLENEKDDYKLSNPSTIGTIITYGFKNKHFCSAEI